MGYSVDKQLAQDLKEIEGLNQELAKTEKRQQGLIFGILTKLQEKSQGTWKNHVKQPTY